MKGTKFKLILVSLDFPAVYEKSLIAYLNKMNIESECVVLDDPDANSWISQVDSSWTGAIPATVIYNGAKSMRQFHEGYMPKSKLKKTVNQMMTKS